jgi:hypothetical protein
MLHFLQKLRIRRTEALRDKLFTRSKANGISMPGIAKSNRDQVDYVFKPSNLNHLQWHFPANINSLALSRMLQVFAESKKKIRALNTCGANFCGSTSPYHFLTQEHYTSLLRKLEHLEHLHMCICYNEKEPSRTSTSISTSPSPSTSTTYLDLLIFVAPRLKISISHNGIGSNAI